MTGFSQQVCPLSQVDLTPCPDSITTTLHLCVCVCGRLCGGSGGVLAYTGLSFVYGMKLYGEQHPLYIVIVWKICLFHVFVTGVLGGGGGAYTYTKP